MFTKGYIRSPAILLRTVSEQLILCMFFKEYPEKEREYRNSHYSIFFKNNRIEKMLKTIDRKGKVFRVNEFTKFNYWNKMIYKTLFEELSHFVHTNIDLINNIMYDETIQKYHKTPKVQNKKTLKSLLSKLYVSTVYSIFILDKSFEPEQDRGEIEAISKATKIINSLNANSS